MFKPLGDQALNMTLGEEISLETHQKVRQWCHLLGKINIPGVVDWLPTYTNITIYYSPSVWEYAHLVREIETLADQLEPVEEANVEVVDIPVCYGGEFGPDLTDVAEYNGLTAEEVIDIHTHGEYVVYMIGFAPGFPYLGGMSPQIATPRLATPRSKVSAGSVGIAGSQTGIYSLESPGGWRIIGRTPVSLFDIDRQPPSLLHAGYKVRFRPISERQFKQRTSTGTDERVGS